MNVASLELCKELYEVSGWEETSWWHHNGMTIRNEGDIVHSDNCPAYDLGYLLQKLPPITEVKMRAGKRWEVLCRNGAIVRPHHILYFTADSPENAACKLAIELFRQGILTPITASSTKSTDNSADLGDGRGGEKGNE